MRRILIGFFLAMPFLSCDKGEDGVPGGPGPGPEPEPPVMQTDFPSAKSLHARLGKGINLGNALDAPKEGDWGVTLKADYFRWIADSGFNSVRLPVRWSAHALSESPYTIDPAFLARVIWAVGQALDNKLLVVLDMHHYDEIHVNPAAERKKFLAMWRQIAKRFAGYPPELLLEILNEPKEKLDAEAWNGLLAEAIDTIRTSNPNRTLVVGTSPWGGLSGLSGLRLPSDSNLIVTVHYYEPHAFTHQGVDFETGAEAWVGATWSATPLQRMAMDKDVEMIRKWGSENKRPIYIGEFGSNIKVDLVSRELWTHYLTRRFDSCGFSWALWNFSSDFGLLEDDGEKWNAYLSDALLHPGKNPMLDSILKISRSIDTAEFVVLEDFEDAFPSLPALARKWALKQGLPGDSSYASWIAYYSDTCGILNPDGILIRQIKDTTHDFAPFTSLIGNWGHAGMGLHLKARLAGSPYPGVGIAAGILGGWDSTFVDLSRLAAVQFRAKGRGEWFIGILSDTVQSDTVESWGHMSIPFIPENEWKTFLFPVDFFQPKAYSKQAREKLTWQDVSKKVFEIVFENGQSYGFRPDDSLELWLDDIRLIGVTEADLGLE